MAREANRPPIPMSSCLLLPYPRQGHINPMLQFAKRLAHKGLKTTLITTTSLSKSLQVEISSVAVERISDGYGDMESREKDGVEAYLNRFQAVGSQALAELLDMQQSVGQPVRCLVYDPMLPWALDVAERFGLSAAAFLTQPCAVNIVYYYVQRGWLPIPLEISTVELPPLPRLGVSEMPSFVAAPEYSPAHLRLLVDQFSNIDGADWVFCNTFQELEHEEINWMSKVLPIRAIGPMVPSAYLEKELGGDTSYGINLFKSDHRACMSWLDAREANSVLYVSFGSITKLEPSQMEELAWGLQRSNHFFLWVVRTTSENKLPHKFMDEIKGKGLVVTWCSQLEVLAHEAVGCSVMHCGWNSTLEAVSLGKPMVAMPQWTDQPTNAKYIEDVWGVGVRAKANEKGLVTRDEIERCIKEVMQGEQGEEIRRNASKWSSLAKKALAQDGSSNKNIDEFVARLTIK